MPSHFTFSTIIPVRITDINYGNHVGNDAILSLLHEARMQFLMSHGFTELNCGGPGLIMKDVQIEFKNEIGYGDPVTAQLVTGNFSKVSFELFYRLKNEDKTLVNAKTTMVCFDYASKKIAAIPAIVMEQLSAPH
ncbi:MAG: thioesterase [Terrimonas sp.]|nr:thioesterase [Terrimonas sp.]